MQFRGCVDLRSDVQNHEHDIAVHAAYVQTKNRVVHWKVDFVYNCFVTSSNFHVCEKMEIWDVLRVPVTFRAHIIVVRSTVEGRN